MSVNDHRTAPTVDEFEVKEGRDQFSSTVIFGNEDHTLGNVLRHIIMQQPQTEFCGYSVPHPYEPKMNIRIQTHPSSGMTALELLRRGLVDLVESSDILEDTFSQALQEYRDGKNMQ